MVSRDRRFLGRKLHVAIELPPEDDALLALIDFDFGAGLRPVQMPDGQHFPSSPMPRRQVFNTVAGHAISSMVCRAMPSSLR